MSRSFFFGCRFLVFASWSAVHGATIVPLDEPTIQQAIDATADGDTILIMPGTYTGQNNTNLQVKNREIRIMGMMDPQSVVIDGEHEAQIIQASGSRTELALERITFTNGCAEKGGAIIATDVNLFQISNCLFAHNRAEQGGAIECTGHIAGVTHTVFLENNAEQGGAVHFSGSLTRLLNVIMIRNTARFGSAIASENGELMLMNCTVVENVQTPVALNAVDLLVTNSILWNFGPQEIVILGRVPDISFSDIRGSWEGYGNIDVDPKFISRFRFDYFLSPASPCVDSGDPSILDRISGSHPRWPISFPNSDRSDMGAFGGYSNDDWFEWSPYFVVNN